MEAPVETANKRTEVTGSVFGEIECMISVIRLDITTQRILGIPFDHCLRSGMSATSFRDGLKLTEQIMPKFFCGDSSAIGQKKDAAYWHDGSFIAVLG